MAEEFFMNGGSLVEKNEWDTMISAIKASVSEDLKDKEKAIDAVSAALIQAVRERVSRVMAKEKFGIMFSGGVDSSLIALLAKNSGRPFTCYTVGFKNDFSKQPEDIDAAMAVAKLLDIELKFVVLDLDESEELIKRTVKLLGPDLNNVVNVGVGSVELACADLAKKDNVKFLFSGLGSEEIFAGYERHKKAKDEQEECWKGLFNMYERDLLRDAAISSQTKVGFLTPFLDTEVIKAAMRSPGCMKLKGEHSKALLREVAEKLGLTKDVAWRKKRAAQYGSRLDKAIDKLAKKKGFEFKKDYLKSLN
ncbi:asparagine synthase C-terminal domain-containing protein [Candidatus Woesearchaeota archaeon]|nr:asparagine synthase C-terminal domain-containing protein [Candidatus Woesearchaeota archaeon]